jgi:hypothetical protein
VLQVSASSQLSALQLYDSNMHPVAMSQDHRQLTAQLKSGQSYMLVSQATANATRLSVSVPGQTLPATSTPPRNNSVISAAVASLVTTQLSTSTAGKSSVAKKLKTPKVKAPPAPKKIVLPHKQPAPKKVSAKSKLKVTSAKVVAIDKAHSLSDLLLAGKSKKKKK